MTYKRRSIKVRPAPRGQTKQASVATATAPKGRPQHANDNTYGPRAPGGAGRAGQSPGETPS